MAGTWQLVMGFVEEALYGPLLVQDGQTVHRGLRPSPQASTTCSLKTPVPGPLAGSSWAQTHGVPSTS